MTTSAVNEVATVFLFRDCFASSFWFTPIVLSWYGSGLGSSHRLVLTLKSRADSLVCAFVSRLCFVEVEAAPAVSWCGFIGWGPPRRQTEHRAVYSARNEINLRRGSQTVIGDRPISSRLGNFLLRGGNNLCATQFGHVQDF